jgi:hypothetical protein
VGYTHAEILPRNRVDRRRDVVDNDFDDDAGRTRAAYRVARCWEHDVCEYDYVYVRAGVGARCGVRA